MKDFILSIILIAAFLILVGKIEAHPSWAIVVDDKNQIYLSDLVKIWKIDAQGRVSSFSDRHTHEMALDKDGNLLGANFQSEDVYF